MATDEEKIAAVQAGLDALPSGDRQNSVRRFVAMWNALEPFLPKPEPLPEQASEATLLVSFKPTDEMRPQVERINKDLGTTTAVITHNSAVAAMADRVVSLADGRIVSEQRNATKTAPGALRW